MAKQPRLNKGLNKSRLVSKITNMSHMANYYYFKIGKFLDYCKSISFYYLTLFISYFFM